MAESKLKNIEQVKYKADSGRTSDYVDWNCVMTVVYFTENKLKVTDAL